MPQSKKTYTIIHELLVTAHLALEESDKAQASLYLNDALTIARANLPNTAKSLALRAYIVTAIEALKS